MPSVSTNLFNSGIWKKCFDFSVANTAWLHWIAGYVNNNVF